MDRQKSFFVTGTAVLLLLGLLMVAPFLPYLMAAVLLAFVTRPLHDRFREYLPASVSAGLVVVITVVLGVLPLVVSVGAVAGDAAEMAGGLSPAQLPDLDGAETVVQGYTGQSVDLEGRLKSVLMGVVNWVAGSVTGAVGAAVNLLIGVSLMVVVQFYAVRDWERYAEWTGSLDIFPEDVQERLYGSTSRATWSVVKGHVAVAVLQGVAAGLGLWVAGVPRVFFWTFLMVVLGFIPFVGSALVWAPAGLFLVATGDPVAGAGLLLYGLVLVGGLDQLARPLLIDESVDLNDLFVLLGVVGGTSLFGPIGIFVGPVLYAVLGEMLRVYRESYVS